ncbi:MAG: hypothetical protein O3A01_02565 [bacterium]|nr:hypothetical protein [bacterium]
MKALEFLEPAKNQYSVFLNFVVFEPSSQRIPPQDILAKGDAVREYLDIALAESGQHTDLKHQILVNRLTRIATMMNLVKNFENVVLTKFLNKVWRRYSFYSNLGELFLDVEDFSRFNPEFDAKNEDNFLLRIASDDDDDDSDDDNHTTTEEADSSDDDDAKSKKDDKKKPEKDGAKAKKTTPKK